MNESDSTQSAPQALPQSDLLQQATALCNELDELMTLHHFFYQAVEHYFGNQGLSFKAGLSVFPGWLRERDIGVLEVVHQLQQTLKAGEVH